MGDDLRITEEIPDGERPLSHKEKYLALRAKYDEVVAQREEHERTLDLARIKLSKLEREVELLLDSLLAAQYRPSSSTRHPPLTPYVSSQAHTIPSPAHHNIHYRQHYAPPHYHHTQPHFASQLQAEDHPPHASTHLREIRLSPAPPQQQIINIPVSERRHYRNRTPDPNMQQFQHIMYSTNEALQVADMGTERPARRDTNRSGNDPARHRHHSPQGHSDS